MSTIDPNQGIPGSDKTAGEVIGGSDDNQESQNHVLDFNEFLFFNNPGAEGGSTMEATDIPGEYLLTTGDGQQYKVINTDEVDLSPGATLVVDDDNPNLMLGGVKDINVQGSDQDNQIMGNLGNNEIDGGAGDDVLGGGGGDDTLSGGEGSDSLLGGGGDDLLTGGGGDDAFVFNNQEGSSYGDDVITDFGQGNDTLILGDFNGDGVFDNNDYTIENTEGGALITFVGPDGSLGSVLLQGVDANQLNINGDAGLVTLGGDNAQVADQDSEQPDDDDDDSLFTIA
jgi:Ca2+-binding RTX toxin-like protein